jgi:hypothetical protein
MHSAYRDMDITIESRGQLTTHTHIHTHIHTHTHIQRIATWISQLNHATNSPRIVIMGDKASTGQNYASERIKYMSVDTFKTYTPVEGKAHFLDTAVQVLIACPAEARRSRAALETLKRDVMVFDMHVSRDSDSESMLANSACGMCAERSMCLEWGNLVTELGGGFRLVMVNLHETQSSDAGNRTQDSRAFRTATRLQSLPKQPEPRSMLFGSREPQFLCDASAGSMGICMCVHTEYEYEHSAGSEYFESSLTRKRERVPCFQSQNQHSGGDVDMQDSQESWHAAEHAAEQHVHCPGLLHTSDQDAHVHRDVNDTERGHNQRCKCAMEQDKGSHQPMEQDSSNHHHRDGLVQHERTPRHATTHRHGDQARESGSSPPSSESHQDVQKQQYMSESQQSNRYHHGSESQQCELPSLCPIPHQYGAESVGQYQSGHSKHEACGLGKPSSGDVHVMCEECYSVVADVARQRDRAVVRMRTEDRLMQSEFFSFFYCFCVFYDVSVCVCR